MNIRRGTSWLGLVVAAALAGCGSSGSNATFTIADLIGPWERVRESEDGGQVFTDTNDGLRQTFEDSSHWHDNRSRSGTYVVNVDRVTMVRQGFSNVNFVLYMYNGKTLMRWTYYTNDSFSQASGVVTEYAFVQ